MGSRESFSCFRDFLLSTIGDVFYDVSIRRRK